MSLIKNKLVAPLLFIIVGVAVYMSFAEATLAASNLDFLFKPQTTEQLENNEAVSTFVETTDQRAFRTKEVFRCEISQRNSLLTITHPDGLWRHFSTQFFVGFTQEGIYIIDCLGLEDDDTWTIHRTNITVSATQDEEDEEEDITATSTPVATSTPPIDPESIKNNNNSSRGGGGSSYHIKAESVVDIFNNTVTLEATVMRAGKWSPYFTLSTTDKIPSCNNEERGTQHYIDKTLGTYEYNDTFTQTIPNLTDNTKYYARACARKDNRIIKSNDFSFITSEQGIVSGAFTEQELVSTQITEYNREEVMVQLIKSLQQLIELLRLKLSA